MWRAAFSASRPLIGFVINLRRRNMGMPQKHLHKSVKSNACFAKSPAKTIRTQSNHIFACLWAYVKLECLRLQTKMNHFALKSSLYRAALASAYRELQLLKGAGATA